SEQIILYVVLAGLLLLLLFCTQIIQRLSNPLKEFARSAHSIAGGNFHTALPVIKTHNEMWELCQSFDFMQTSLNGYIEELKEATSKKERIESELRIARDIQMGMIPKIFPPFPDRYEIDLFAVLQPAKEVGGDLYDFFIDGDKLFFAIGDVAGKGVPASLFMAVTRSLFRTVAAHLKTPLRIVESMNNSIVETSESNMFVTLFVGVLSLDSGRLSYCNAGHNPPLLITPEQEVAYMQVNPNIPVGLFYNFAYTEQEVCFAPDTTIVLYTDGLTEAENSAFELFSEARLLALLCADSKKSPKEITCHIVEEVHRYAGEAEQSDDLTLLTINYNPNKRRINDAEKLSHKE
ncbi:MAG: SpoIIE family protein phosphatase, partial [Tannerellaceae bacterium]